MKLKNQYCTAAQGKQLMELGIDKNLSHAYWYRGEFYMYEIPPVIFAIEHGKYSRNSGMFQVVGVVPAFSVAEIIAMVPDYSNIKIERINGKIKGYNSSCSNNYNVNGNFTVRIRKTIAESLCSTLINILKADREQINIANKRLAKP